MTRRTYTPEQKAEALALYMEHGTAETARRTGISEGTLASWVHRAGLQTMHAEQTRAATETVVAMRAHKREELRSLLIDKAVDLVKRMDEEHIDYRGKDARKVTFPKAPAQATQQYATAAAILLDKFRLEVGEATDRTEHVNRNEVEAEVGRLLHMVPKAS